MKKSLIAVSVLLLSLTLAACSNNKTDSEKDTVASSTKKTEETMTSSTSDAEETSTFKGKLSEAPIIENDVISLKFDKVEAINDPDDIVASFNSSGVILSASADNFVESLNPEDLVVGDELEFIMKRPGAMTNSIPPQIPGMSIESISLVE